MFPKWAEWVWVADIWRGGIPEGLQRDSRGLAKTHRKTSVLSGFSCSSANDHWMAASKQRQHLNVTTNIFLDTSLFQVHLVSNIAAKARHVKFEAEYWWLMSGFIDSSPGWSSGWLPAGKTSCCVNVWEETLSTKYDIFKGIKRLQVSFFWQDSCFYTFLINKVTCKKN